MQAQLIRWLRTPCSHADGHKALTGLAIAVLCFIIGGALYSWTSPTIFVTAGLLYAKVCVPGSWVDFYPWFYCC